MGRALHVDRAEPFEAPDPMIDVNDKIARRNTGKLGNDGKVRCFESAVETKDDRAHHIGGTCHDVGPGGRKGYRAEAMVGQYGLKSLGCPLGPGSNGDALTRLAQAVDMRPHGLIYVCAGCGALGSKISARQAVDRFSRLIVAAGDIEGRQSQNRALVQELAPFWSIEIKAVRRQWLIRYGAVASGFQRFLACPKIFSDLLQSGRHRLVCKVIETYHALADVVEKRFQAIVE